MTTSTRYKQVALEGQTEQLNLQMLNKTLEVVQSTKYIGVHIHSSLEWKKHIQETSKKI